MKGSLTLGFAAACLLTALPPAAQQAAAQSRRPAAEFETETAPVENADGAKYGLLKPTNVEDSWHFELNGEGEGAMWIIDDAAIFLVSKTTGTNWHVQAYQPGVELEEGKQYVVRFQMKSPEELTVLLTGQIHEPDWHEVGLHEEIVASKEYKDYEFTFTAAGTVKGNNRVGVVLGDGTGIVYLKNLSLTAR